jgi:hypothetical protein
VIALLALVGAGIGVALLTKSDDSTKAVGPAKTSRPAPAATVSQPPPEESGKALDAKVGDCIEVDDASATDADIHTIGCGDRKAVYKVAVREDDSAGRCPGTNYVSYTEEGTLLLCMTLNAKKGECFHEDSQQDARVPCDSANASYQVGDIYDGTDDGDQCGSADAHNALTYPQPPLTICRLSLN